MDETEQYIPYETDDVFGEMENGSAPIPNGMRPSYRRSSSSATTSQTPFIKRESVRRISEAPGIEYVVESNHKYFTILIVTIVVLAAVTGFLFYRLEVSTNDLQRQLSELQSELDVLRVPSPRESQPPNIGKSEEKCECPPIEKLNTIENSDSMKNNDLSILQCCSKDSEQVKNIISKVVKDLKEEIFKNVTTKPNRSKPFAHRMSPAFAHVYGKGQKKKGNNGMTGFMTEWIPSLLNRLSFRNGVIEITNAGTYFVYSQIYFYQDPDNSSPQNTNDTQTENHEPMIHETWINRQAVMKSAVPFRDFTSKYHGGVFKLDKGDLVRMRVSSNEYHVNMDPQLTFFGVYCIEETREIPTTDPLTDDEIIN